MAFEGLRNRLRSLASSGSGATKRAAKEARRQAPERAREAKTAGKKAAKAAEKRAPATELEGNRKPAAPGSREEIARRLQSSGEMRKPIPDANLSPSADPRFMERFGRGDADTGEWFGESNAAVDANERFFGGHEDTTGTRGEFVGELLDERDHEGGLYAYEDEHEEGWLDDGVPADDIMAGGVNPKW